MVHCQNGATLGEAALWFMLGVIVSQSVARLWKLLWKRNSN